MKVELKNLVHTYVGAGKPTLNGLSQEFGSGEFWAIVGPNGSGKSTLLKAVAGFAEMHEAAAGVFLDGAPVRKIDRSILAKKLAFVPSSPEIRFPIGVSNFVLQGRFPHLSGLSAPTDSDKAAVSAVLDRAGILEWKDRDVRELSTGEKQLVVFARALAQDTKLLLLDESVANLDLKVQRRLLSLLKEENAKGATVLLVSHDLSLVGEHVPKVLWLKAGQVVASGDTKSSFTSDTIGQTFDIEGQVEVILNAKTGRPQFHWN